MEHKKEAGISIKELAQLSNDSLKVSNNRIYEMAEAIANAYVPVEKSSKDARWNGLYLETRDGLYVPVEMAKYGRQGTYFISIGGSASFVLEKGEGTENSLAENILLSISKAMNAIENVGEKEIEARVPVEFRTGKILGKYVLSRNLIIDEETSRKIEMKYIMHRREAAENTAISLKDYLEVAKICYKAVFPTDSVLTARSLY